MLESWIWVQSGITCCCIVSLHECFEGSGWLETSNQSVTAELYKRVMASFKTRGNPKFQIFYVEIFCVLWDQIFLTFFVLQISKLLREKVRNLILHLATSQLNLITRSSRQIAMVKEFPLIKFQWFKIIIFCEFLLAALSIIGKFYWT